MAIAKKLQTAILCLAALAFLSAIAAAADSPGAIAENPIASSVATPAAVPTAPSPAAGAPAAASSPSATIKAAAPHAGHFSILNPKSWPFTLVPVPEIATDPNEGTTAGALPVFLFNNDRHEIEHIIAPDVAYNTNVGGIGNFRYLAYPSDDVQWYATGGAAQRIARKADLFFSAGRTHSELWSFDGRLYYERDPNDRFFGIGNTTQHSGETNFTTEQLYFEGKLGLNITREFQIALDEKPRYVRIKTGAIDTLPFIGTVFPNVKGLNGGSDFQHRLLISYDTRDSPDIPRHGGLLLGFGGFSDRALGSSVSYTQVGGEARRYIPINDRITLAGHLYLQYIPAGNETPFWAMARLGGDDSLLWNQQTLRGYGAGRFVDNNLSVANIEARTRVYERDIFDTHGIIELAPFLEAGKVFHNVNDDPINRAHPVGGLGVRGIAEPFVVGYVDVGLGGEGASIFSGINYPF